jgi:hypothetical protein
LAAALLDAQGVGRVDGGLEGVLAGHDVAGGVDRQAHAGVAGGG